MADEEFELDVLDGGKAGQRTTSKEVMDKIKALKEKKDYRGILELAKPLQNSQ